MLWKELVKIALLGSERSNLSAGMKTELQGYGIDTDKEITEVVLESAAMLAPLQKAGFLPEEWEGALLNKSKAETLDNCSKKSANHFALIISGQYPFALTEFVQTMADHNKCLPFEFLPEVLDKCVKDEGLWEKLQPTIGNRGKWLIGLNPAWQKLVEHSSPEKWETSSQAERILLLKALRKKDPIAGLNLLLTTWAAEGLTEKTSFLKCLAIGLSDSDEAFLEACLDFPRKEVREVAAKLLSELPNSQLHKRIFIYLNKGITLGKEARKEKPIIILPDPKDKALIRDGINPKKKWKRGGATTGMLYQLVSILPPEKWEKHFQKSPEAILTFFTKSEWAMMLVEGVANAAALHRREDWMEAIFRFWLNNYANQHSVQLEVKSILDHLPNEVFNEVLFQKIKTIKGLPEEHSPIIQLLQREGYIWEDRLVKIIMSRLKIWLEENVSYSWSGFHYRKLLKRAAYAANPKIEKSLSTFWMSEGSSWGGWDKDLQQFLNVLSFRKEMLEEIEKTQTVSK